MRKDYERYTKLASLIQLNELAGRRTWAVNTIGIVGVLVLCSCKDLTGSQALPAGTPNPGSYQNKAGALGMRTAALSTLENVLTSYIVASGLLSDELESNAVGASAGVLLNSGLQIGGSIDERILPELSANQTSNMQSNVMAEGAYDSLQSVRGHVSQALGALAAYDTATTDTATKKMLRGELFALGGYAEILLADLFCSGVPLSTLDFNQDFTYHAGAMRDQVYEDASAKEDSALALADTSTQVLNLARVLKGRALLALGRYVEAGQAVSAVPQGFQYELAINLSGILPAGQQVPCNNAAGPVNCLNEVATISDGEGGKGLLYRSSGDPRTTVITQTIPRPNGDGQQSEDVYFPNRYIPTGFSSFPVADWIEARLITAEAALRASQPDSMVRVLNYLRRNALVAAQTTFLSDTTDPGGGLTGTDADTARQNLLFHERAFWLFLTGHRQGDLRRMIRQYNRRQDQVYPTGVYTAPGIGVYGSDVTVPIPGAEYANPLFHGCIDRAA